MMRGIQIKEYVKVSFHLKITPARVLAAKQTFSSPKGPEDLRVTNLPDPKCQPDQYLINIHAAATNFFDLLQIRGKYQHQPQLPWIAGMEFSGVVAALPPQLPSGRKPRFKVGDKVFGASQGAYATQVAAKEESLKPVPKGWDFLHSAGLFVTGPTSYAALVTRAKVQKGGFLPSSSS